VTAESRAQGTEEYDTFAGEAVEPPQGVSRPSAEAGDAAEAEYRRTGTVALQALPATEGGSAAPAREPPPERTAPLPGRTRSRRRRRWRPGGGVVLLLLGLVLPLLVGAWLATRAVYFVGTDPRDDTTVAIFRGLPYELPFGIDLYERWYTSGVTLEQVPTARRETFTDHQLRSRDDVEDLVRALERGNLE
jgi:protein phosphatase